MTKASKKNKKKITKKKLQIKKKLQKKKLQKKKLQKKKKTFYGRTDRQPKTIVRNLTINKYKI